MHQHQQVLRRWASRQNSRSSGASSVCSPMVVVMPRPRRPRPMARSSSFARGGHAGSTAAPSRTGSGRDARGRPRPDRRSCMPRQSPVPVARQPVLRAPTDSTSTLTPACPWSAQSSRPKSVIGHGRRHGVAAAAGERQPTLGAGPRANSGRALQAPRRSTLRGNDGGRDVDDDAEVRCRALSKGCVLTVSSWAGL